MVAAPSEQRFCSRHEGDENAGCSPALSDLAQRAANCSLFQPDTVCTEGSRFIDVNHRCIRGTQFIKVCQRLLDVFGHSQLFGIGRKTD